MEDIMELEVCGITKQYKDKCAVDDVSLKLTPGVWGLLGANGAGKTTLMRIIAGILRPTAGCVKYDGIEIDRLKEEYRYIRVSASGIRILSGFLRPGLSGIYCGAEGTYEGGDEEEDQYTLKKGVVK